MKARSASPHDRRRCVRLRGKRTGELCCASRDEEKIAAETALDGIYVIRTSVPGADPGVTDHLRQASTR
jgi:hypothetical protein